MKRDFKPSKDFSLKKIDTEIEKSHFGRDFFLQIWCQINPIDKLQSQRNNKVLVPLLEMIRPANLSEIALNAKNWSTCPSSLVEGEKGRCIGPSGRLMYIIIQNLKHNSIHVSLLDQSRCSSPFTTVLLAWVHVGNIKASKSKSLSLPKEQWSEQIQL